MYDVDSHLLSVIWPCLKSASIQPRPKFGINPIHSSIHASVSSPNNSYKSTYKTDTEMYAIPKRPEYQQRPKTPRICHL